MELAGFIEKCTLLVPQNEWYCWDTVWCIQLETYRHQHSNPLRSQAHSMVLLSQVKQIF